ncbi:hypothetical protein X975_04776, partial [Stegodyphus mimosarum]
MKARNFTFRQVFKNRGEKKKSNRKIPKSTCLLFSLRLECLLGG